MSVQKVWTPRGWRYETCEEISERVFREVWGVSLRETLRDPWCQALGCANCAHEMFQPFHGCDIGKQKTFAEGGENCARFIRKGTATVSSANEVKP